MAIKLNGVEITSNKLNSSDVTLENLDGVKVWPTAVPATGWSMVGATNDYIASFEQTGFLIDPSRIGCGYSIADLPSASLYLVGDIVRGRSNPISGNPCDTWVYYEAVGGNEWVYLFSSTSAGESVPGQTGTNLSIEGNFGGDINQMQDDITSDFPPDNYDVGQTMRIEDYDDGYFYYFQVGQK